MLVFEFGLMYPAYDLTPLISQPEPLSSSNANRDEYRLRFTDLRLLVADSRSARGLYLLYAMWFCWNTSSIEEHGKGEMCRSKKKERES